MKSIFLSMMWLGLISLGILGCQHDRGEAKQAVARELEARQERRNASRQLYDMGLEAYHASNFDQAQKAFQKSVNVDDRYARAWLALGVVEFEQSRLFEAAKAFDQAAGLLPTRYEPHYNLGIVFEAAGRYSKAISAYQTALRLAPDQIEVMENLARCYLHTEQQLDEAERLIKQALHSEYRPEWRRWLERQVLALSLDQKVQ